ncbi:MAG TPA: MBL fold metallo-hydrolase [Candidatus Limnocylindrales bacterium]|nr:MBL fold metallo-hydrolase [Candidatus Limnocylindrales bacterium]
MPVTVRFFGSGNAFAAGGRSHACIHLSAPGVSLLLDCGGSALPAITRGEAADSIDAIAVSHLHGDHFGGIPYLVIQQHYAGRTRPLTIAGPRELGDRLRGAGHALYPDFFGKSGQPAYEMRSVVLGATEAALGGALVSALPVSHVPESDPHGLRVRIGDTLIAYSGDATWSDELPRIAKGADLFICEATNWDLDEPAHVSYRTLFANRAQLDCKRIVLTHLGASSLAHLGEMELEYATDGLTLTV